MSSNPQPLPGLPAGITSRIVPVNELDVHILEAKPQTANQPTSNQPPQVLILLHGFPEISYSWRKIMVALAQQGYSVVAPDQRGFGQTRLRHPDGNRKIRYEDDLAPYGMLNLAGDIVSLVNVLGYASVSGVIGHDFGSIVASYCALIRPDLFKSVVVMSAPFTGTPSLSETDPSTGVKPMIHLLNDQLALLDPPRKHYTMYYSTPKANADMSFDDNPDELRAFLRTYFHVKSGDWKPNSEVRELAPSVLSMSTMPVYYIMPLHETMPGCLAAYAPTADEVAQNNWLSENELSIYVSQYSQTGFQGGLNWYRCQTDPRGYWAKDTRVLYGKQIKIPAMFISGKQDWGVYQFPGALKIMQKAFGNMADEDVVLVEGAGHWVQQEKPEEVLQNILRFLKKVG